MPKFTRESFIKCTRYTVLILEDEFGMRHDFFALLTSTDSRRPGLNVIDGTHYTPEFLSGLAVDRYQLHLPVYRELLRLTGEKMSICGQTVSNWLRKGHELLQLLLPSLKSLLLKTKSILHIDETWCRVRIVKEEFKDAYAVYRFFADLNKENERSLCRAHVRAKFKYASDISKDIRIHFGDMMNTALNYMINGWQELLNYRHDDRYDIDNTEAERKIRPLTIGRKNTLFFGSEEGVEVATTYYHRNL